MTAPVLLTPGPLTTSEDTKAAMLSDWGSWDSSFNDMTASVCRDLLAIVNAQREHVCVPLQGSGTFAVEAALGTLVPRTAKVLVPDNGSYCKRMVRILGARHNVDVRPAGPHELHDLVDVGARVNGDDHGDRVHQTAALQIGRIGRIAVVDLTTAAAVLRHGLGIAIDRGRGDVPSRGDGDGGG